MMDTKMILRTLCAAAVALIAAGCSSGGSTTGQFNTATAQHPSNWTATHYTDYYANPDSCTPCHGSSTDPTQAGGTSGVSCFGCHHPNGPNHPINWDLPANHGRQGAQLVAGDAFSIQGIASCQTCHGTDFKTAVYGNANSCYSCHTKAPHPDAPWGATNPPPDPSQPRHDETDPSNAPVCFTCHYAGSAINTQLGIAVVTPQQGAAPGCTNNTMCHGANP